ncbi:MAG: ATP-dependent metallopeptidase FtsH/Yme1/Tma family protein, partial [Myxococcota bacterium]
MRPGGTNLLLLLSALAVMILGLVFFGMLEGGPVPYSEFKQKIEAGEVASVTFRGEAVEAELKGKEGEPVKKITTVAVPGDDSLVQLL